MAEWNKMTRNRIKRFINPINLRLINGRWSVGGRLCQPTLPEKWRTTLVSPAHQRVPVSTGAVKAQEGVVEEEEEEEE